MFNISRRQIFFALLLPLISFAALTQPSLSVVFSPNAIGPGSNTRMIYTINNTTASPVTGIGFSNTLPVTPGPVTISNFAGVSSNCDLGTTGFISAPSGGTTITLSDARIGAGQFCTIEINVTASTIDIHTNPAVTLTSSAGSSMSSPTDLEVDGDTPSFSKNFSPNVVTFGGRSTLTFTIDNTLNTFRVGNLDFTDNLPIGMTIASPANAFTNCISTLAPNTTITAIPGTSTIILDATGNNFLDGLEVLSPGAICTVSVDVVANAIGSLENQTNLLSDFSSVGLAVDTLEVSPSQLILTKDFTDDPAIPGGNVTLEFNILNTNRNFSATSMAFTDDLASLVPALSGLTFNSILNNGCSGSSLTGIGGSVISFSNGTLAAEASCSIAVSLSVPAGAAIGSYNNTTTDITGMIDGNLITDNPATATLFVEPSPILTKEFLSIGTLTPNPVVNPGDDVVLRFTIENSSATSMATDITFQDELTDGGLGTGFLPFPVSASLPPTPCGAGSNLLLLALDIKRQALLLTDGTLDAAPAVTSSCSFDVTLTIPNDFPAGFYTNTTGNLMATVDGATRLGNTASDTLTVIAAPVLTKAFADDPVAPGGTVTLEFTLEHSFNSSTDATNITFTDDLSTVFAGLTANVPPLPNPPCGIGSSLTASAGDTLLTFSGGTLAPGESCTFSVTLDVPISAASGSFTNTTSMVSAIVSGQSINAQPAIDDLNISGIMFNKEYLINPVVAGETTTLRFTIENVHPTDDATLGAFTDNLTANLSGLTATGLPSLDTCGGGLTGTTFLIYTGGNVASGSSCVIEVPVLIPIAAADGNYNNTTSNLSVTQNGNTVIIDPAFDTLVVDSNLLQLTKTFTNDPAAAGGPVTLEFVLTNLDVVNAASDIDFTDDLNAALAGLTFDSVLFNDCGATVSGTTTTLVEVTNATLAAGDTCTITTSLTVPVTTAAGLYTNTTSMVTGMINGFAVDGDAATDVLEVVELLVFNKSFDGPTTATGTAILTFTITNPGISSASNIIFSDDLDAVIPGLIATSLPTAPCGATSGISGTSLLAFTGGELSPLGGTCSFDVEVTVPVTASAGTFPNSTSDLFISGLTVAGPATADLVIESAPIFAKIFTPDSIGVGLTSTLTLSIDNTGSTIDADNLSFTDNLPAGLILSTTPALNNTCGGTVTAVASSSVISLANGSVAASSSCIIQIETQASNAGDLVNLTGDLTSSSGNSGTATDTLTVNTQPLFSKTFSPTPILIGGVTTLTFTIDNTASTVTTTALSFTDNLPADLIIATPANTSSTCGGTLTATDAASSISLSGGTIAAGATCSISVDITANASGNFVNVTSNLTSSLGNSGTATDTLEVNPAPLFTKIFAPDVIANGDTSTLTFTIDNNASTVTANTLDFVDNLPSGMTVATPANVVNNCTGGAITANAGSTSISYSGGIVNANASCTISVEVSATQNGILINQTGDLTSSSGNSGIAMANLTVTPLPTFSKNFMINPTIINVPTTLVFAINNTLGIVDVTGLTFSDNLPVGMQVATIPNISTTCTGGTVTAVTGTNSVTYTGGTVSSSSICNVFVDVIATVSGNLDNISSVLSTDLGDSNSASATLNVDLPPLFSKAFTPDAIAPNGISQLVFTIDNTGSTFDASGLSFVDNFPANLFIATPANANTDCIGGSLTATDGGSSVSYTAGTVTGSSSCTINVDVTSSVLGMITNTTGDLTSSHGNSGVAVDQLLITNAPTISKAFTDNPQLIDQVNTLTFSIDNSSNSIDVTDLAFNDPLPTGMVIATPANTINGCVGGTLTAVDGANAIDFTGGMVNASSTCSITVDVITSAFGTLTNTTSTLSTSLGNSNTAVADLTVDPAPVFTKAFTPSAIGPNDISQLQLTIDGTTNALNINAIDFADTFPTGLIIASPSNASTTCDGGTLTAADGSSVITYTGGALSALTSCSITVDVTSATNGTYTNLTGDLTSDHGNSGQATADLVVTNAPTLAKAFTFNPHVINVANPLVFTVDNDSNTVDVSNLSFTDPLPTGLEVANPANTSTTCTGGTLTAIAGTTSISYNGGSVNASSTCTISVDTIATVTGQFTNTTSTLSTSLGASNQAIADLTISSSPLFSKTFTPDNIVEGGVSQLVFSIDNTANNLDATSLDFTDNLPAGTNVADPANATSDCIGGTINAVSGSSIITYTNGTASGLSTCTVSVDITSLISDSYTNVSGDLTSSHGNSGTASDVLTVQSGITASKSFASSSVVAGEAIVLNFSINNNSGIVATNINLSDDLQSFVPGSIATDLPQDDVCGTGSNVSGSSVIVLNGGQLPANGSCQFSVTVIIPEDTPQGDYVNITSPVTADFNGTTITGADSSAASADLIINGTIRLIPVFNNWFSLSLMSLLLFMFARRKVLNQS